jgi:hypothetical protein
MLLPTSVLAAVDAQLAACERAMVGSRWQKEDARNIALWRQNMDFAKRRIVAGGVAGGYTKERLIESFLRTLGLAPVLGSGGWHSTPSQEYYDSLLDTDALIELGGGAYPLAVIMECRRLAGQIFRRDGSR